MKRKHNNVSKRMLFTWFMLGGLICLFAPPRLTGTLQLAYTRLFAWPLAAGRNLTLVHGPVATIEPGSDTNVRELRRINTRLRNHVANLQARLAEAKEQIDELSQWRSQPQWRRMRFLPAGVIALTDQAQNALFINRGQDDGLVAGQFVMGDNSIIGTVSHVMAHQAKVRLITDPTSRIPVQIGQSDIRGVMQGRKIPLVQTKHAVRAGDIVCARTSPGLLEAPVVTATVSQVDRDAENPLFWDITVEPACEMAGLETVAVMVLTSQAP